MPRCRREAGWMRRERKERKKGKTRYEQGSDII
jgi:hypothetical protein